MNNYIVLLIFVPGLFLIFMFTKASFIEFLLGFGLCLLGEAIFIICYCIVKMQQALLDSARIKLQQNYSLDVEKQFPFKQRKENMKIFLNKYTEEEKLQTKKNTLKVQSFQNYTSEEEILSEQPKKQMLKFLKEKHYENNMYSYFNKLLIGFGRDLTQTGQVSKIPLIQGRYGFEIFEQRAVSQIAQQELYNFQRQLLDELEIKIKIKKDKQQNIILPNWTMVVEGLKSMGREFVKIQEMHDSNKEIINMVNTKIIEDFEFIESEIKKSLRSLDQIQKTSLQLKKENQQFLSGERNVAEHQMDLIFLLKQHYYKFQDFQLRIKENQKNYHLQVKRLSYFRQKLSSFSRKNKQKYQTIFKTRFFAILDSYNITIEESIKTMRKVLSMSHSLKDKKPPKVNRLQIYKNVDHQIEAQKRYQSQYFERVQFYHQMSEEMVDGMRDLAVFLQKFTNIFVSLLKDLQGFEKQVTHTPQYNRNFTTLLILKFAQMMKKLHSQSRHLTELHTKFIQSNEGYLLVSQNRTLCAIDEASQLLRQLSNPEQPLQHKYKITKLHLQQRYQTIQFEIQQIKRFYFIYLAHSNRIKKVLIMEVLSFLNLEKLYMSQSDFIKTSSGQGLWISHNEMGKDGNREQNEQEKEENIHSPQEFHIDNIYTGQYLCEEYTKVINRFFFSAYSEWKNSQFFKETLTKELYILLNKEEDQSISQVIIKNLQLTGYPPQILWIRELHSEPFEFLADVMIAFKGKLIIYLKTEYKLMGRIPVPTEVKVELQELYCVVRLCFVPSEIGQSWFSFIGEPIAKFTVEPKIYTMQINVGAIRNFFSTLLLKKLKESTFPIRQKIMIPVSKEDAMLELIQKRFKSNYNF